MAASDKVITYRANTAAVNGLYFRRAADGTLHAQLHGQVTLSDGSIDSEHVDVVIPNGALKTQVLALMDGQALLLWRTNQGLET